MMKWFAILAAWSPSLALAHPVRMTILDFSTYARFDLASAVELKTVPDTRFIADPDGTIRRGPTRFQTDSTQMTGRFRAREGKLCPTALLAEVQGPALKSMLRGGYISRSLYDAVIEAADIWEPQQVRLAFTWSELTLAQAKVEFSGKIPWDRVMHGEKDPIDASKNTEGWEPSQVAEWERTWPAHYPLRIVRALMMVGVGQVFDPLTGEITFKPMAWQQAPVHAAIANLDRKAFPFVAEFSRALSETGPLPGDIGQIHQALCSLLQTEALLRGFQEKDVYIFARAFSRGRVRLFESKFGARLFSNEVKTWFETQPEIARQSYLESIPRIRSQTSDAVVMATSRATSEGLRLNDFSQRVWEVRQRSGFALSPGQAWHFLNYLYTLVRPAFRLAGSRRALSNSPILLLNASPCLQALILGKLYELGLTDPDALESVTAYAESIDSYMPDPFGTAWLDPLPVTERHDELQLGIGILNLDERAALADPLYVPTVLFGVRQHYRALFDVPNPLTRDAMHQIANAIRARSGMGPLAEYDPVAALDSFRLFVGTGSAAIAAQLAALGGTPIARPYQMGFEGVQPGGHIYIFEAETVTRLGARIPGADSQAPLLETSPYQTHFLIQSAGHF